MNNITISSGGFSVEIGSVRVVEKFKNKVFVITPGTTLGNFGLGPKDNKLINLLRVTREVSVNEGYISASSTKTAKQVKADLIAIFNGGLAAEAAIITYDGNELTGFLDDLTVIEKSKDLNVNGMAVPEEAARYEVQLNFLVGTLV